MPKRSALIVAVVAALLASCGQSPRNDPPVIGARSIAINKGMAGIALGMTPSEVRQRLGAPNRKQSVGLGENGESASVWTYRSKRVTVAIAAAGVVRIETDSRQVRTDGGFGVGSSQQTLARELGLSCSLAGTRVWCTTPGSGYGDPQTVFVVGRGRVTLVRIVTVTP